METPSVLIASIVMAVACTMIEAVLAHTFSETIESGTAVTDAQEPVLDMFVVQVQGGHNNEGSRKMVPNGAHNTAYTMMQSLHSVHDKSHQTTIGKQNSSRRLDATSFLQGLQSHK
jgi:hypothetical protein